LRSVHLTTRAFERSLLGSVLCQSRAIPASNNNLGILENYAGSVVHHSDKWGVWYHALRPFSYPASIIPVLVGTVVAWQDGYVNWLLFLFALFGSVAIQAGTNLANEYFDYTQGVDKADSLGPAGVILEGKIKPRQVLLSATGAFVLGTILGLYIVSQVGFVILAIGLVSVLAAWFYTAKPLSLGYRGLGEPEVFLFMGPITVMASYYVQARSFAWTPLLISLPVGLLVMAILHANNMRDVVQDKERGRITWAVLACRFWGMKRGKNFSRWIYSAMLVGAYIILIGLVAGGTAPIFTLLTFLTIPQSYSLIRFVASGVEGRPLSGAVRGTARLHMTFGITLTFGYLLSIMLH
jgi:1,4-dihydroxy-2-naphthoate polyprenyltransferase